MCTILVSFVIKFQSWGFLIRKQLSPSTKCTTNFLCNCRSSNGGSSSFYAVEHTDRSMLADELTGTLECAGWQPKLTFEVDITCNQDALPRSLVAEALWLKANEHDNGEISDSTHYQLMVMIKWPVIAKWECAPIYSHHFEQGLGYDNGEQSIRESPTLAAVYVNYNKLIGDVVRKRCWRRYDEIFKYLCILYEKLLILIHFIPKNKTYFQLKRNVLVLHTYIHIIN